MKQLRMIIGEDGMDLRDWFACMALQGMGVWIPPITKTGDHNLLIIEARAEWAYKQADAMMKAREEQNNG